jgi:hypothetical protein
MINQDENCLVGKYLLSSRGVLEPDVVALRIQNLISGYLLKVMDSGWEVLYKDPGDGRFWELTYPQSEMQGGGPPMLALLSKEQAMNKWKQE